MWKSWGGGASAPSALYISKGMRCKLYTSTVYMYFDMEWGEQFLCFLDAMVGFETTEVTVVEGETVRLSVKVFGNNLTDDDYRRYDSFLKVYTQQGTGNATGTFVTHESWATGVLGPFHRDFREKRLLFAHTTERVKLVYYMIRSYLWVGWRK